MGLNNRIALLIILIQNFIYIPIIFAQNPKGVVLNVNNNKPLVGVNIYTKNNKIGLTTDSIGLFSIKNINELNESDTIYFSHIGYTTQKRTYTELVSNNLTVFLHESPKAIAEVSIVAKPVARTEIRYKKMASLKNGIYAFGSLILNDSIYIIGGNTSFESNEVKRAFSLYGEGFIKKIKPNLSWENYSGNIHVYDIKKDCWASMKKELRERAFHNVHYYDNKLFILGGKRLSTNRRYEYLENIIEVYDLTKDSIIEDNNNPHPAASFASVISGKYLFVIGGSTSLNQFGKKIFSNKVHLLDLGTGYWYELKEMPTAKETKGILLDNKIYLVGGFNGCPLSDIETYNILTGEWRTEAHLSYPVERPALASHNGVIYVFENGIIQTFNTQNKNLVTFSIDLYLRYAELLYSGNKLYIIGGFVNDEFSVSPSPYLYSIDLFEFRRGQ